MQAALIGVAGNAPAYSVAVSSAALAAAAGAAAPLAIFICGLVTLGILFAYARLNAEQPNAGAAYAWVGTILHPAAGFFAGWCVMLSSLIFMISATLPAGTATLLIIAPAYANEKWIVIAVAAAWLAVITVIVSRGTKLLGRVQSSLTVLELGLIALIAGGALAHPEVFDFGVLASGLSADAWSPGMVARSLVVAIFMFWGWDVIFNLAEETRATERSSARAGFFALALLTAIFVFFAALIAGTASTSALEESGGNAIFMLADRLLPKPLSYVAVLTFLLSVIGGIEASIVSFSRTVLASARDGRLPMRFARLHPQSQTPVFAVLCGAVIVLVLLLISAAFETVDEAIVASINATGIIVAAYYAMAALACAVFFRRKRESHVRMIALYVVWPLASAAIFLVAALLTLTEMSALALAVLMAGMLLGAWVLLARRDFRRGAGA